jgi:CRISPR-associated protein Csx10
MSRKPKQKQTHKNQPQISVNTKANNLNTTSTKIDKWTIQIKLTSDWHIGCGAGIPGDIDSLVQKDKDGIPYIPAKTLTGIWRDACELLAFGLDDGKENGTWQKWVDYLFGEQPALAEGGEAIETSPIPAALSIRPAYFSQPLREILNSKPNIKNALTFVKPGISIDVKSGCAKEEFLRFEEVVRSGAKLEAECELTLPVKKDQKEAAYAFLVAGTKFVERLGGKRRRGTGKCQLVIKHEDIKYRIDWISKNSPPDPPSRKDSSDKEDTKNIGYVTKAEDKEWVEVSLGITTKSPLIISKRTVGNLVETLDYIPGTHLLKLITKKISGLGVDLGSAIANSDIIITNATLEVNKQQGRPVPLALFYEKLGGGLDKGGKVYNRFIEPEQDGQLKGYRAGYIDSTDGTTLPHYETIKMSVGTHNTIEDQVQRTTKDSGGGIYSYEAIQAGTKLQAKLKLRQSIADVLDKNSKNWRESLPGNYRIGQSKKDDYGDISLEVLSNPQSKYQNPKINNNELTVWLLSDVLLRDERLRPTTDIKYFKAELEKYLKVEFEIKSGADTKLTFIARTHRIDSWQVHWGLPRPSLVGLAAGTCIVFEVKEGTLKQELLTEIESRGIGERRAEGYGQICFNDPILISSMLTGKQQVKANKQENSAANSNLYLEDNQDTINYAYILERAAWKEIIHRASLLLASDCTSRAQILNIKIENKESKPPMSQLGSLRSVLTRLESPDDEAIEKWIQHLQQTKNRFDKWPNGSLDKLRQLITSPTEIWEHLSSALSKLEHKQGFAEFTLTATGEERLKKELWLEAVQILIDACIRAHKRELESQQNNTQKEG